MKLAVLKEVAAGDNRVAVTPETVKKYIGLEHSVAVQAGAGVAAGYTDQAYTEAGATIASDAGAALKDADVLLSVRAPDTTILPDNMTVIGLLDPFKFDAAAFNAKRIVGVWHF